MAEAFDVAVAPHCPLGPIALASCIQVDASSYNAFIQEQSLGVQYSAGDGKDLLNYLSDPSVFKFDKGYVNIPKGPGLGIEINESYVKSQAEIGHNWQSPMWFNEDGSIAEW
jgi:galactonate dehydratase